MAEDDWEGWVALTEIHRRRCQLVGDDLFVTNPETPGRGHRAKARPTRSWSRSTRSARLTETLEAVEHGARGNRMTAVMSHRSGETEDATIADLAVATNCGQIKTGSLARSDRLAKYNQLIRIEAGAWRDRGALRRTQRPAPGFEGPPRSPQNIESPV